MDGWMDDDDDDDEGVEESMKRVDVDVGSVGWV